MLEVYIWPELRYRSTSSGRKYVTRTGTYFAKLWSESSCAMAKACLMCHVSSRNFPQSRPRRATEAWRYPVRRR